MPLFFRRRIVALGAVFDYSAWLTKHFPLADRWDHQDIAGSSVLEAYNTALALGRDLVINGGFTDWTGDDPDSWVVSEVGDATSNVTQNPAGKCQIISDGTNVSITQVFLQVGATYTATMDVSALTGDFLWGDNSAGSNQQIINSTGAKTFSWTAGNTIFIIKRRSGAMNATIDNVIVQQTNIAASGDFPGEEKLPTTGTGTTDKDNFGVGNDGVLSNITEDGQIILHVARGITNNPFASTTPLTTGKRYVNGGQARGDGNANMQIFAAGGGGSPFIGTPATDWQNIASEFVAASNAVFYQTLTSTGTEHADWRNLSLREANPMNGDTVVAQVGVPTNFGSLELSVVDDGATSYSDISSAEINSKFNPAAGFINIWAKVSGAGVWTDSTFRVIAVLQADASNVILIRKNATVNQVGFFYVAGGVTAQLLDTSLTGTTDWFMMTTVWEKPGNQISYLNGVAVGSPQAIAGTWVGNLAATTTVIGAQTTTPASVWDGARTRFMLGYEAITAAQVLSIYNQGRR